MDFREAAGPERGCLVARSTFRAGRDICGSAGAGAALFAVLEVMRRGGSVSDRFNRTPGRFDTGACEVGSLFSGENASFVVRTMVGPFEAIRGRPVVWSFVGNTVVRGALSDCERARDIGGGIVSVAASETSSANASIGVLMTVGPPLASPFDFGVCRPDSATARFHAERKACCSPLGPLGRAALCSFSAHVMDSDALRRRSIRLRTLPEEARGCSFAAEGGRGKLMVLSLCVRSWS